MENKKLFWIAFLFLLWSCVPDDDFNIPQVITEDLSIQPNSDLDAILGVFFQNEGEMLTFDQEYIVEAYVVSSDEAGNFYKDVIVQDHPTAPLAGLKIKINLNSYYQFFNFGRKVFINLKGLSIAEENGVATLGIANGRNVDNIPQSRVSEHIIRSSEVADIQPLVIKPIQFNDHLENLYVEIRNVQFPDYFVDPQNPFTFAAEDNDEFDGERLVENCEGGFPFILSTSTFADFSGFQLPAGSGSITGILTRDFYDDFYTIYLNSPNDINFSSAERCDRNTVDCGLTATTGKKVLFEDNFTGQTNNKPVKDKGWTNFIQEGSKAWEAFTATGGNASLGKSARVKPSGSGDALSIAWLVTPKIDFENNSREVLNFKTSTSFANGSMMSVLIATDWDGTESTILNANWQELEAAYIAQNSDFFGDWISSGNVDLSCIEGKAHIAFKYTGSDHPYYNGIYELDDILITAD
ncbi:DUF5689 domain-containing protein [Salinimicrobium soli]|uniref:DUF5689 domain-containing protein n=1 Tax=Salinimicrobium soli TaxID=1254399 RepID=UPI003AB03267